MSIITPDSIFQEVESLRRRVDELSRCQSIPVSIATLAPRELKLNRDIPIVVTTSGDDFIATFFDAGISASGDNEEEAVFNLKDLIGQTFEVLSAMPESKLGKLPRQQLASLRIFISSGE